MRDIALGIDVGSTTVKLVVLDPVGEILARRYVRANGQPRETLLETSRILDERFPGARVVAVGLTGSGGSAVASLVGGVHNNELVTQTRAVGVLHPEARTVIEIGGQDSKFLSVEWDEVSGQMVLGDFAMNALCAAGTGSFLDQQAERLGIRIDGEFARLALASEHPARVAGRCTVFAKSDMIHLQQEGTPLADILAGLCQALARNFKSVIGKGKRFTPRSSSRAAWPETPRSARAFEEVLSLEPGELIVPEHCDLMAAIGAAHVALDEHREGRAHAFHGFGPLEAAVRAGDHGHQSLPPLAAAPRETACFSFPAPDGEPTSVYLGVDVGSISTNLVLLDEQDRVVARRYLLTAGRPLDAVREGLRQIGDEIGHRLEVLGVGTTGSARHLVGQYVGADVVRNEITAQARAAVAIDPAVDTVFEIGGQDSKFIRIDQGVVVNFAMNNACAAGTGSFLEEQAERLDLSIREDFARLALEAPAPACLGERCTVFMESDLVHHQQRGASVENLTAGLAYSIVHNYLNRVVGSRTVGDRVLFLGGVAHNAAVAAAFEAVLGRPVRVPPHHDVTGAIGAALLAREERASRTAGATRFRGFECTRRQYESRSLVCRACANLCEVKQVTVDDEAPAFYGARCDRFDDAAAQAARGSASGRPEIPDLFAERSRLLLGDHQDPGPRTPGRTRVGLPRVLAFHDLFPFWRAFFRALDMDVVLSDATHPGLVRTTAQHAAAETCFPVKLVFGHVLDLLDKDVDLVFLPSVVDREAPSPGQVHSHHCPLIPASPHMVRAHVDAEARGARYVTFPFHLQQAETRRRELAVAAKALGVSVRRAVAAAARGDEALAAFSQAVRRLGDEALEGLAPDRPGVVLVGRPYNTCDPGVCLDLPRTLRKLGAVPIPIDCLPVREVDITDVHPDMYWRSGQDILGAARLVAGDRQAAGDLPHELPLRPRFVPAVLLPPPDGGQALPRAGGRRPHRRGRDAHAVRGLPRQPQGAKRSSGMRPEALRTIYLPRMSDHALAVAAAMRAVGLDAEALPEPNEASMAAGVALCRGTECLPCFLCTGDLLRKCREPGFDPRRAVFFMPTGPGPCRFGQYRVLQKSILEDQGFGGVDIVSPTTDDSYALFGDDPVRLRKLAWQGIVAVDLLTQGPARAPALRGRPLEQRRGLRRQPRRHRPRPRGRGRPRGDPRPRPRREEVRRGRDPGPPVPPRGGGDRRALPDAQPREQPRARAHGGALGRRGGPGHLQRLAVLRRLAAQGGGPPVPAVRRLRQDAPLRRLPEGHRAPLRPRAARRAPATGRRPGGGGREAAPCMLGAGPRHRGHAHHGPHPRHRPPRPQRHRQRAAVLVHARQRRRLHGAAAPQGAQRHPLARHRLRRPEGDQPADAPRGLHAPGRALPPPRRAEPGRGGVAMTTPAPQTTPAALRCSRLRKGALSFAVLTAAGLVGLFVLGPANASLPGSGRSASRVSAPRAGGRAPGLVLGGLRFQIFIRRAHPTSPLAPPHPRRPLRPVRRRRDPLPVGRRPGPGVRPAPGRDPGARGAVVPPGEPDLDALLLRPGRAGSPPGSSATTSATAPCGA